MCTCLSRRPSASPPGKRVCISLFSSAFVSGRLYQARRARRRLALLGSCRRCGVLRQPGWWPPAPAHHWYAGRRGGARCRETPALGSREKWLSLPDTPGLAQRLSQRGQAVTVVDQEATAFERLGPKFTGQTVLGAALDREVLLQAGIERVDGLAAVTGSDDTNVVIARLARQVFRGRRCGSPSGNVSGLLR